MRSVICHPPGKTNDEVLQLMLVGANESFAGGEPVEVAPPQSIVTWFAKAAPANNSPPANRTKTFFIIRVSFILLRIYLKYCVTAVSGCSVIPTEAPGARYARNGCSLTSPYDPTQFRTEMQLNFHHFWASSTMEDAGAVLMPHPKPSDRGFP